MNKLGRGLLAAMLLIGSTAQTALKNDRTFLAHRDDVSNLGMDWVTNNHYNSRGDHTNMGATFTVSPFFAQSTNHDDLARLFGMGTTKQISVTKTTRPTRANMHSALYSFNIDHSPNSDGTTSGQVPMSGTVNLKPQRQVWGAHLNWNQSLDTILKGLRFSLRAPITEVSTTMGATFPVKVASSIPTVDGGVADIDEYFKGDLTKALATSSHVIQSALNRQKFDGKWHSSAGIGDVVATLHWNCCNARRLSLGVSASVQLPAGAKPTGEWLFEATNGGRGHVAAGMGIDLRLKGFSKGALSVNFDVKGDWKYSFKSTEKRTLGIYDLTNSVTLPGSSYRNLVAHKEPGVIPAANVMTVDTDVTPGHQFEGLAGLSASWYNWTFDVGYNVYLREKEKVEHKAWTDDKYAVAHHRYSAYTSALGTWIIGGNTVADGTTNQSGGDIGSGDYNDTNSPVKKHQNHIGANRDAWTTELTADQTDGIDLDDVHYDHNKPYSAANFSMNGPVQSPGKTTSALSRRTSEYDATGNDIAAGDRTGIDVDVFNDNDAVADVGTLTPRYNTTTANAVTEAQITHSVVGGLSYKFSGNYPVIATIGGQGEFQDSNHNSALEGWKVFMKFGMSF